jgi:hypothetical protein
MQELYEPLVHEKAITLLSRICSRKANSDTKNYCITGICGAVLRLGPGVALWVGSFEA